MSSLAVRGRGPIPPSSLQGGTASVLRWRWPATTSLVWRHPEGLTHKAPAHPRATLAQPAAPWQHPVSPVLLRLGPLRPWFLDLELLCLLLLSLLMSSVLHPSSSPQMAPVDANCLSGVVSFTPVWETTRRRHSVRGQHGQRMPSTSRAGSSAGEEGHRPPHIKRHT